MSAPVVIVDYDPAWPALYRREEARVLEAIGHLIQAVEHVGSTAVPGLGAKPIIDIMVAVTRLGDATQCMEPLERIGYQYVPENEDSIPERRYFTKGPPGGRTHHLHMVELDGGFWDRHLLFRDYLRAHPQVAEEYHELKMKLADEYGSDRESYTEAKSAFIRSVEARGRALTIPQPLPLPNPGEEGA